MIDLNTAAILLAWAGVAVTAGLVLVCLPSPAAGMKRLSHRLEQLPEVMLGRYLAFFGFSLFSVYLGDLRVIAAWIAALAFMAFADTYIYLRRGYPYLRHLIAGVFALVVLMFVLAALTTNGAV